MDSRGNPLGAFRAEDLLLIISDDGTLKTTSPELSTQFKGMPLIIERWIKAKPITLVYYDENKKEYFIKREYLNHELQKIVIDSFDTGYTDETGLRELVTRGSGRLAEMQLVKEKKQI